MPHGHRATTVGQGLGYGVVAAAVGPGSSVATAVFVAGEVAHGILHGAPEMQGRAWLAPAVRMWPAAGFGIGVEHEVQLHRIGAESIASEPGPRLTDWQSYS